MRDVRRSKKLDLNQRDKRHLMILTIMMIVVFTVFPVALLTMYDMYKFHDEFWVAFIFGGVIGYSLIAAVITGGGYLIHEFFKLIGEIARAIYIYAKYKYNRKRVDLAWHQSTGSVQASRRINRIAPRRSTRRPA